MPRTYRNLAVALAFATCTTGLLAACGDDDEAADTTDGTAAVESAEVVEGSTADVSAFCDAYTQISALMAGEPDPAVLTDSIRSVEESVPDEIAEQIAVTTGALEQFLASGGEDVSALEAPELSEAQSVVDPYVFERCEFDATVEVTGEDFAFTGLPETIESGLVAMLFTNDGAEAHEIAVMRRNDGVEESFEELLALPEDEAMDKVTPMGGAFAPSTGSSVLLVSELEPGDYLAICFVPTGTTVADGTMTEGTGDPHFAHGMQQEFTVTG